MERPVAKKILAGLLLVSLLIPSAILHARPPNIQVVGLFLDKAAVKINGEQIVLEVGMPTVHGVLLVRSNAKRAIISINGVEKIYGLGSHVSTKLSKPGKKVVRIPSRNGMYFAPGQINGRSVDFLIDTGASVVSMGRATANELQIPFRETGIPTNVSTASQVNKAWQVNLDTVTVGGITLNQVTGVVIDTDHHQQVLLGMSFLGRIKFSQEQGLVVLEAKMQ